MNVKLETLSEALKESPTRGTYVAVNFSKDTAKRIKAFIKKYNIPNPLATNKLHTTIIYSRKYLPEFKTQGKLDEPWVGKPSKLEIFKSREGNNCLVVLFTCKEAVARHKEIMKDHEATYGFPEFKTHFTLSYDSGDFDPDSIKNLKDELGDIEIVEEYTEDLNLDWAKKSS
jgi:hypothetical protein